MRSKWDKSGNRGEATGPEKNGTAVRATRQGGATAEYTAGNQTSSGKLTVFFAQNRRTEQRQQLRAHIPKGRQTRIVIFSDRHNIVATGGNIFPIQAEKLAYQSARPVAPYSRTDPAGHGQSQSPGRSTFFSPPYKEDKRSREQSAAAVTATREILFPGQPVFAVESQTVNFLRPLARRRRKISRPAGVLMRARNPWTLLRLILLGLYVLFIGTSLCILSFCQNFPAGEHFPLSRRLPERGPSVLKQKKGT
jgi:hypothetical protein